MPLTQIFARRSDRDRLDELDLFCQDVVGSGGDREDAELDVLQRQF